MLVAARTGAWSGKALPYDAEVEYLESTGTQWIDTGVIIPPDTDFEFTGSIMSSIINGCIFGETNRFTWGNGNPGYSLVTISGSKVYLRYGDDTSTAIGLTTVGSGNTFTAFLSGTSFQINGQSVATVTRINSFAGTVSSMGVFRRNYINYVSSTSTFGAIRINNLKFGNLFDFIPVRKGTVGYFYDRVSGQLFGNQGTDAFIIGPDKTT